jgi:hypothetical protein
MRASLASTGQIQDFGPFFHPESREIFHKKKYSIMIEADWHTGMGLA